MFTQNFNDDKSSSADFASTPSGTPEDSIPTTTTTSTEVLSSFDRLRLQRQPWVSYFQTNKIRFILSALFLLLQLSFLACRLVLPFADYRLIFSVFSAISGTVSFSILWAFIPDPPPYLASKSGIPLYKQRTGKLKNSVGLSKPSWFQRLLLQKEPWTLHLKNYALECGIALVLFAVFLTLAAFRLFTSVDDPATFAIAAAFSYALGFAFAWLLIPEAPPFLATPDGLPVFKAFPVKWNGQSFKNI